MRITPNTPPLTLVNGAEPKKLLQNMRPGQLLQATVIGQVKADIVALRIGTQELQVHTRLKLVTGQRLTLELTQTADKPALRLVAEATGAEPKARLLRQALPNQQPATHLLSGLRTLEPSFSQARQLTDILTTLRNQLATVATRPTDLLSTLGKLITQHKSALSPEVRKAVEQLLSSPKTPKQPELIKVAQQVLSDATARLSSQARPQPQALTQPLNPAPTTEAQGASIKPAITMSSAPEIAKQLNSLLTAEKGVQLQRLLGSLLERILPGDQPLLASQIRRALSESGLFLETHLARGEPPAANDLKANLVRLLALLRPLLEKAAAQPAKESSRPEQAGRPATPENLLTRVLGELLRQSEGSLARVQLHQLSSLPPEDGVRQAWQFELPIQYRERVDNFLVRLEQETNTRGKQDESAWRLTLNFDFQPLGPVEARLTLQGEEVSSLFKASRPESAALIEKNLPRLNDAFERAGLKVGRLHARHAEVSIETPPPPSPTPILDEKA